MLTKSEEKHTIISTDAEKAFDKTQHNCMINAQKTRHSGMYL
jgi:hypothetical protein